MRSTPPGVLGLCLLLVLGASAQTQDIGGARPAKPLKHVSLQLKWVHQFQFAGYYAARELGYYAAEGLDVSFIEGTPTTDYSRAVVSGSAQFGIDNSDILLNRVRGQPVVVLGVIFQHSPLILLSLRSSHLESPKDFVGKRVMVSEDAEAETYSIFRSEGIDAGRVKFMPHTWNLEDLVAGRTDAVSAYSTNEALQLRLRGIDYASLKPLTYGIDFYGDCIFTSEQELRRDPGTVAGFLRASLRGWDYAMAHPGELCDLILAKYSTQKTRQELLLEAEAMQDLIVPRLVPIGFMNPGRWKSIGDTYARLGTIPSSYSLDGFLYDPNRPLIDPRITKFASLAFLAIIAVSLAYIFILRAFNRRLETEVGARTRDLESLNSRLGVEIEERKAKETLLADSLTEKEVLLREIHHRVKNNLQIIMSIVNLEMGGIEEESTLALLREIKNRVHSIALVHEHLYESVGLGGIEMRGYIRALVREIVASYRMGETRVEWDAEVDDLRLPIEVSIPLGLIIGELMANSLKYAFAGRDRGRLEIRLLRDGQEMLLVVADDGNGHLQRAASQTRRGIGLDLVEALVEQMSATMTVETDRGRRTIIRMPGADL